MLTEKLDITMSFIKTHRQYTLACKHPSVVFRLPAEIDATKMVSTLSAFGILTVEALVPETSVPAATIIPIKVITSGKFIYI